MRGYRSAQPYVPCLNRALVNPIANAVLETAANGEQTRVHGDDRQAKSSRRTMSAPALKAISFPLAMRRDKGAMPQLVQG